MKSQALAAQQLVDQEQTNNEKEHLLPRFWENLSSFHFSHQGFGEGNWRFIGSSIFTSSFKTE